MVHAGALVNSLAAANQEVPKALMDLASRDSRFRKGLGSTGSAARGRGRGGAGRGRSQVRTLHSNRHCCLLLHRRRPVRCIFVLILRMLMFKAVALTESETHFWDLHRIKQLMPRTHTAAGWRGRSGLWHSQPGRAKQRHAHVSSRHCQGARGEENSSRPGGWICQGRPGIHH